MKKKYIQPISQCIELGLEDMIAQSIGIVKGDGEGSHDAGSKIRGFFEESGEESDDDLW